MGDLPDTLRLAPPGSPIPGETDAEAQVAAFRDLLSRMAVRLSRPDAESA